MRAAILAVLVSLAMVHSTPAQQATWQFRWQPGQVHSYRVEQVTSAVDVVGDNKAETSTKLNNVKRWRVLAVDANGVATLQLSLAALRIETTRPNGDVLLFDSANPDKSNPELREQLAKYVGQPLATLRIDAKGKVVEVKESKFGPASRYDSEPPFVLTLPAENPHAGQTWERAYPVTLEPPHGTGEKFDATQKYAVKGADGWLVTLTLATAIKNLPEAAGDQLALLQFQPEGEIVFDLQNGLLKSAKLRVEKEVKGHQGEGSSYRFRSTYTEEYVGNK